MKPFVCRMETLVIIGSHSGKAVVLNINTGNEVSSTQLPDRIESSACICPSKQYYIIGIELVFLFFLFHMFMSMLNAKNKFPFEGCYDGRIYKIEVKSGIIAWNYQTGDMVKSRAVVYEDSVLFGSYDKHLYSIQILVHIIREQPSQPSLVR